MSCFTASAFTNAAPFGVPTPVTLSHPGVTVNDESVPKVSTSQRELSGLLYRGAACWSALKAGLKVRLR